MSVRACSHMYLVLLHVGMRTHEHDYECVCGSVSGIKKPSHRQSPAVNETGPDVGASGGVTECH